MLQAFDELTMSAGISADIVHRAFRPIPEYRLTLPAHHPDALQPVERAMLGDLLSAPDRRDQALLHR
jgi:hypothetical protein